MNTKLNFVAAGLTLILIFTNSCKEKSETENASNSPELKAHLITPEQGNILAAEYENNNYKIINQQRKTPDAKQIYYDIDVLEEYIQYVKAEAKSKGISDIGITVSFGQYPVDANFDKRLNPKYLGYQTIFLKPTSKSLQKSTKKSMDNPQDPSGINPLDFGQLTPPH